MYAWAEVCLIYVLIWEKPSQRGETIRLFSQNLSEGLFYSVYICVWMYAQGYRCSGRPEEGARVTGTGVIGVVSCLTWELGAILGSSGSACFELLSHLSSSLLNPQLWDPDSMQATVMDVESAVEKCSPHPSRFYIQHWRLEGRSGDGWASIISENESCAKAWE